MKVAIVVFAVLGLSFAAPAVQVNSSSRDLQQDFEDILAHIPLAEWREVALKYVANDAEFQEVIRYLQGPDWAELVNAVGSHPTWIRFKDYLQEAGIDVEAIIKFIHDLINGIVVPSARGTESRGLREFLDECLALIDLEALLATVNDKLANSADFQALYLKISSDDARAMFEEIRALPEVQRLAERLKELGVDVDAVVAFIYAFLGWTRHTPRDLQQDFEDILAHIPLAEWREVALKYVANDAEFQEVIRYLQGPDWAELVNAVGSHPTWIRFKDYLQEAGIDVEAIIKFIHDLINGIVVPSAKGTESRGLREFLDECLALIDLEALLATVNDKLANSADFQALYLKISSDDARAMFEEIRALPEVQRLAERLKELGVDVDAVVAFIYAFLGWTRHTPRDLQQDFEDILAHIPLAEWHQLALKYVATDAEFQEVILYLQGPEWAELVNAVGSHPTWIRFKDYLQEAGIDVEAIIKFIHDLINGIVVPSAKGTETRGIREFLDECLALIDLEALLATVNDKLANSADFLELYLKISSDDAHAMFEEIRALPEVQRLLERLREMGIDVDAVIAFIYAFLGWN